MAVNILSYLTAAVLLCVAMCSAAEYKTCDNTTVTGTLNKMEISNCSPDKPPCILRRGNDASLKLTFTPSKDSSNLTVEAYATLFDLDLPFKALDPNGCDPKLGITCPLKNGTHYTYSNTFKVEQIYPPLQNFTTKWILKEDSDSDSDPIICVQLQASII